VGGGVKLGPNGCEMQLGVKHLHSRIGGGGLGWKGGWGMGLLVSRGLCQCVPGGEGRG